MMRLSARSRCATFFLLLLQLRLGLRQIALRLLIHLIDFFVFFHVIHYLI